MPKKILRVDLSSALGRVHIAPALAHFVAQYPDLQVKASLSDLIVDLNEDGIDVSVRSSRCLPKP